MPRFAAPDGRSFRRQSWFPFPCGTGVVVRRSTGLFPRPVLPFIGEPLLTAPCRGVPEFGAPLQSTLPPPRSGRAGFETLDPAPVALGCSTGVPMRRFLVEPLRPGWHRLLGAEEVLGRPSATYVRRSSAAFAGQQAFAGWHDRQIAGDHAAAAEGFARHRRWRNAAAAEFIRVHRGDSHPHTLVLARQAQVGKTVATAQWRESSVVNVVDVVHVIDVHDVKARPVSAPPGEKTVTGADGKPAYGTEAEANPKASASKPEERDISRRPDWTIKATISVRVAGPPYPRIVIHEPASVV